MSDDFYPFVDSGDPAPDNAHLTGKPKQAEEPGSEHPATGRTAAYACRIAVYDDMLSAPRVIVIAPSDVRTFLEEITNTVYRCMKEQGGSISLQVIREICENFIHADFQEPTISVLDGGNTIRFADQGPGIADKERAFEFGVTSADREQKRYIRGTGSGFPIVQDYLTHMGGAVSIEDNMGAGTVVTVTLDPERVVEIERAHARGAAVRPDCTPWRAPANPSRGSALGRWRDAALHRPDRSGPGDPSPAVGGGPSAADKRRRGSGGPGGLGAALAEPAPLAPAAGSVRTALAAGVMARSAALVRLAATRATHGLGRRVAAADGNPLPRGARAGGPRRLHLHRGRSAGGERIPRKRARARGALLHPAARQLRAHRAHLRARLVEPHVVA